MDQQASMTALRKRVARKLAEQGEALRVIRESSRMFPQYGPAVVVDVAHNCIIESGVSVDELAERLGVA